jgi:endonuclease III
MVFLHLFKSGQKKPLSCKSRAETVVGIIANMAAFSCIAMQRKKRTLLIIKRLKSLFPQNKTSLKHKNPFQLLIATILSAQSTDITANKVASGIFKKYKGIKGFSGAKLSELEKDIFSSGFYRAKSKNIIAASEKILSEFNGRVPNTMHGLLQLPGVGRKTANIILSSAFKKSEGIAVDTHVKRISRRLGFTKNTDSDKIERDLLGIIPRKYWLDFNYMLVDFGRKICKSKKPLCLRCGIEKLCRFKDKNI